MPERCILIWSWSHLDLETAALQKPSSSARGQQYSAMVSSNVLCQPTCKLDTGAMNSSWPAAAAAASYVSRPPLEPSAQPALKQIPSKRSMQSTAVQHGSRPLHAGVVGPGKLALERLLSRHRKQPQARHATSVPGPPASYHHVPSLERNPPQGIPVSALLRAWDSHAGRLCVY